MKSRNLEMRRRWQFQRLGLGSHTKYSIVVLVVYPQREDTKEDVRLYVEKEVQYMHAPQEFKSQIIQKLFACAVGNCLLASHAPIEITTYNNKEDLNGSREGIPSNM